MYYNIFRILFCPYCSNAILFCHKKQGNLVICYNMNEREDGKLIETSSNKGNKCYMPERGTWNGNLHTDRKQQYGCQGSGEHGIES
jgi:uncharacterized protein YbaR (Trm112 family)